MDIRKMLLGEKYNEAVKEHGESAVKDEISEMIFHDLADKALLAAESLGYKELEKTAKKVVANGTY